MTNYDTDFYTWTQDQAALLKAGRLNEIDIDNLIEEIETMGRSEKRALESSFKVLFVHLLKWQYQPVRRGRSWQLTIKTQRIQLDKIIMENPGLKPLIQQCSDDAYQLATIKASQETGLDEALFPEQCPWTMAQITQQGFFPD